MPFPNRQQTSTGSPARPGSVSSSAPPAYRAKKKKPGEVDSKGHADTAGEVQPRGQNDGRLTGAPTQMGAGRDSMFANGRAASTPNYPRGGPGPGSVPPQQMPPPTPNYPRRGPGTMGGPGQMQGQHPRGVPTATHMMADGGMMGSPSPIGGGMPDDQMGPVPGDGSDPMAGAGPQGGGEGAVVTPEALHYHDDEWECQKCQFMDPSGQCSVLKMAVSPQGACNAFSASDTGGAPDQGEGFGAPTGADMAQGDDGTSGAPQLG